MLVFALVFIILLIALGLIGFVVHGLFWLFIIAVVLFVVGLVVVGGALSGPLTFGDVPRWRRVFRVVRSRRGGVAAWLCSALSAVRVPGLKDFAHRLVGADDT